MGCCHVKINVQLSDFRKKLITIRLKKVRMECEQSFMKFIIRDIIFDFSDTSFMDSSELAWYQGECGRYIQLMGRYICLEGMN